MFYKTAAGILKITTNSNGVESTIFTEDAPTSEITTQNIPTITFNGTPFQIKVWQATLKIPTGQTKTYHELAQEIGKPKAHRAVANALGQNKIAYFIPCHRVIRKDGSLGGYKWGIERKRKLLESEGAKLAHQR